MIRLLDQRVAGRIAAGEVIDRPFSIVRELLDNAIDAGAGQIDVELQSGGLGLVAVRDNGHGIGRADLERVALRHATSKITDEHDLERVTTLGFRGEALASIAACARLELTTRTAEVAHAGRLVAHADQRRIGNIAAAVGTRVEVTRLFVDLPARRRFLRRPSAETALCRRVVTEKALAHPGVTFRLTVDGEVSVVLPATSALQRVADALGSRVNPGDLAEVGRSFPDYQVTVIGARPELAGRDRSRLLVFVNRRRIQEYALVQAVEYGYAAMLPGGRHPVACLLVEISPHLVDFNVHPAKREVRFRHLPPLHQAVVRVVQELVPRFGIHSPLAAAGPGRWPAAPSARRGSGAHDQPPAAPSAALPFHPAPATGASAAHSAPYGRLPPAVPGTTGVDAAAPTAALAQPAPVAPYPPAASAAGAAGAAPLAVSGAHHAPAGAAPSTVPGGRDPTVSGSAATVAVPDLSGGMRYLGQALGVFLLVEIGRALYFVDQHAAHERVLYEDLRRRVFPIQRLLLPIDLELDADDRAAVLAARSGLAELGIVVEAEGGSGSGGGEPAAHHGAGRTVARPPH